MDADDERRIVELFVHRQPFYDAAAIRRLTGLSEELLDEALREGVVDPAMEGGTLFTWEDVASLALERWTPRQIARALQRAGYAHVLPPLNEVRVITVELPVYQIRYLHQLAEEKSTEDAAPRNVSDIIEYELAALIAGRTEGINPHVSLFEIAALFTKPSLAHDRAGTRCLYCGEAVPDGEEICLSCRRRHVPGT